MATADEWRQVRDAVVASEDPDSSPHTRKLYAWAVEDGSKELARKWAYSSERSIDLIHNVLARNWTEILEAESPRALFIWVLVRRAIDRNRRLKRETSVEPLVMEESVVANEAAPDEQAKHRSRLDAVLAWLEVELSPRDLRVFVARALLGESSREVAEAEGLTIANVDQIVSRGRARLLRHFDADSE
jgi:RNA polymerase sigma factor (sigma-70 family)